jgi:ADP-ribosylglycohydrolase
MRAAPIGAFFSGDPERAATEATRSAQVTHAHPEGQAGATAVAVAASLACSEGPPDGAPFLRRVLPHVPVSRTRERLEEAAEIDPTDHEGAVSVLGSGQLVAAFDTVPYCLWVTAHCRGGFGDTLWTTVRGLGDMDTTCAIVGGIASLFTPIPQEWLQRREPLPEGFAP